MAKKLLLNYFNTDIKEFVLAMFEADDFRVGDSNHKDIIGEMKSTKTKIVAPNGHNTTIYTCNGIEYMVFSDWSALPLTDNKGAVQASTINRTTFEYRGADYRLTGYYWGYKVKGGQTEYIRCAKEECNAVSGYGVCGVIVPCHEVKFLDRVSFYIGSTEQEINDIHIGKLKFYKSLPEGLTEKEISTRLVNSLLEN